MLIISESENCCFIKNDRFHHEDCMLQITFASKAHPNFFICRSGEGFEFIYLFLSSPLRKALLHKRASEQEMKIHSHQMRMKSDERAEKGHPNLFYIININVKNL
jgi:hypothetical protein